MNDDLEDDGPPPTEEDLLEAVRYVEGMKARYAMMSTDELLDIINEDPRPGGGWAWAQGELERRAERKQQ